MSDTSEDILLRQLARHGAERDAAERHSAHEATDADPGPAAARRPLDAAARARIVDRLKQVVPDRAAEQEPLRFPPRNRPLRWVLPLAAVLVMALTALLFRGLVGSAGDDSMSFSLPAYALQIEGAVQSERGGEEEPLRVDRTLEVALGNRLQVVLTPAAPAVGEIVARAFVAAGKEAPWRPVDPAYLTVSEHGAVRFDAILGSELPLTGASARLLLMLGDAAALPAPEQALAATPIAAGARRWQTYLFILEIGEPP